MNRYFRTSCYNPNTKKVVCKSIVVKPDDDENEVKEKLVEWREKMKKKFKLEKARNIVNEDIVDNIDEYSYESEAEDEDEAEVEDERYKVQPLDIEIERDTGSVLMLLGSSKSGKSYLTKHLYDRYYSDDKYLTVLYATNLDAPIYKDYSKDIVKTDKFIHEIPKIQNAIQKGTKLKYKFLNILDDCVDNTTKNSMILKKLMVSMRNKNISSIINMQWSSMITKSNRNNAHYVFLLHFSTEEGAEDVIKKYLKSFLGCVGDNRRSMGQMIKLYQKLTSNYQFITIRTSDNRITVNKL